MRTTPLILAFLAGGFMVAFTSKMAFAGSYPNMTYANNSNFTLGRGSWDPGFAGISFEKYDILSSRYPGLIDPNNTALINMFKKIGVRNLRLGGSSADNSSYYTNHIPAASDENNLAMFAHKAGVDQLVYTLGMNGNYNVTLATLDANRLWGYVNYPTYGNGQYPMFEMGNEPDHYGISYSTYLSDANAYYNNAVLPLGTYGGAACGPDVASNANWVDATTGIFWTSTMHYYPGGNSLTSACSLNSILNITDSSQYQTWADNFTHSYGSGSYRISETNTCYNGGKAGVSNTFASVLWALDFMHWMDRYGISGVNFHTGGYDPNNYSALMMSATQTIALPLAHAIKAFNLMEPVASDYLAMNVTGNPALDYNIRMYIWTDSANPNIIDLTVINRYQTLGSDTNAIITLDLKSFGTFTHSQGVWLTADSVTATENPNDLSHPAYGFELPMPTSGNPNQATRVTLNTGNPALGTFPLPDPNTLTVTVPGFTALLLKFIP